MAEIIGEKVMNSIWLLFTAWLFSGILGFFLGVLAGKKRGGIMDRIVTGYSLFVASTPAFWVAMVLLMVFAVKLHWFPIGFSVPIGMDAGQISIADRIRHALLPVVALSITGISSIALHTREKLIEVMESDYVLFARARGESDWSILRRHGLRNILLPAMTLQFASVSEIIGGSVLVEQVFSYPGLGQAAVTAGLGSDVPLLLGITVVTAVIVAAGNLAANVLYGVIDPRIREGRSADEEKSQNTELRASDPGGCAVSGHCGARKVLAGSCHQDGFYEKKSGTVYTISFWNGLDGT